MNKAFEIFRFAVISPEILAALGAAILIVQFPVATNLVTSMIHDGDALTVLVTVCGIPLAILVATYALGGDVLWPEGKAAVLLQWPEYWRVKYRVMFALAVCILALLATVVAYFAVRTTNWSLGTATVGSSWAAASAAIASVALAKWNIREILNN